MLKLKPSFSQSPGMTTNSKPFKNFKDKMAFESIVFIFLEYPRTVLEGWTVEKFHPFFKDILVTCKK